MSPPPARDERIRGNPNARVYSLNCLRECFRWLAGLVPAAPVVVFFVLAFAFTWAIEIPMLAFQVAPLQFVVGWMPGAATILVAGVLDGRGGIRTLLRRLLIWRVGFRWYALAVFGFLAMWFVPQALNPLFGGTGLHAPSCRWRYRSALSASSSCAWC